MLQYLMVSNIRDVTPIAQLQPNRSFELFNRMVTVAKNFCPETYVSPAWIDYVIAYFKLIHHGGGLSYDEIINEADFNWTRDILDKCIATATAKPIRLTRKPTDEEPPEDDREDGGGGGGGKPIEVNLTNMCTDESDQVRPSS